MPSPIVHLEVLFQLTKRLEYVPSDDLILGVISPDAIHMRPNQTWSDKALTHFYERADYSFTDAIELAKQTILCENQPFKVGYLIHLYTDYLWREQMYTPYFLAHKDVMLRSDLHALYYREMQTIDALLLNQASWVSTVRQSLSMVAVNSCPPLLSEGEINQWRLKVIETDLLIKPSVENEVEVFQMTAVQRFIASCCDELVAQLHLFKD